MCKQVSISCIMYMYMYVYEHCHVHEQVPITSNIECFKVHVNGIFPHFGLMIGEPM